MTKNSDVKPLIEFSEWTEPVKVNPYVEKLEELDALGNENAVMIITVDAKTAFKEKSLVQRAANEIGKTARVRLEDTSKATKVGETKAGSPIYQGLITFTFSLTEKHKARKPSK